MRASRISGFTLVELLVVLVILGALTGLAIPIIRSSMASADKAGCLSNLRQVGIGLQLYLQENQQRLPPLEAGRRSRDEDLPVLETVLLPYVDGPEVFRCPADPESFHASGSSYLWNTTQSGQRATRLSFFGTEDPSRIPLVLDKEAWHPGNGDDGTTQFLYADLTAEDELRFAVSPGGGR
jgi:prepilin-type N-terminal cleavage/methylation domain-containing protein